MRNGPNDYDFDDSGYLLEETIYDEIDDLCDEDLKDLVQLD